MCKQNLLILTILSLAFVSATQAQWHPEIDRVKGKTPRVKTVTKTKPPIRNKVRNRYANQEISYRKGKGNEVAVESIGKTQGTPTQPKSAVFEPNNEPLWAKRRVNRGRKIQSKQPSNFSWGEASSDTSQQNQRRAKNQDIEVENDETHRTQARTETVDKDETLRTKPKRRN